MFWNILIDPSERDVSNGSPSDRQRETLYYTIGGAAGTVVLILITLVVVLISYRRGVHKAGRLVCLADCYAAIVLADNATLLLVVNRIAAFSVTFRYYS